MKEATNGVCVLGMHRSGTSLVAGVMSHLGIDLGPEQEFLPPDSSNPRGYFELAELVHLNNEILVHFEGSWSDLPDLPPGWEDSDELAEIRDRARRLLSRHFAATSQWAWKDPRTSVTLPFWQRLVHGLRYVICVRNPVAVANSLRVREGDQRGSDEYALDWLRHTASSLVHTVGRPRLIVHYERFFEDPEREVTRLAEFLGCEERLDEPDRRARILDFIDPAMVHEGSPATALADLPSMPFDAAALHLVLQLADDAPEAWAGIDALAARSLQPEGRGYATARVTGSPATDRELDFIRDISPRDGMKKDVPAEAYYRVGLGALTNIRLALEAADAAEPRNILDLPSGHGRVLRMLKAAFPEAELTACDIDRAAVDFCADTFGAIPAYSTEDPADLRLEGDYDLIWCGSLLTHLGSDNWRRFLPWFERQLSEGGVLVFTTHGRSIAEDVRTERREFPVRDLHALAAAYERDGFGYEPYPNHQWDYGISLSSPAWVCRELERCPTMTLLMYTERGWDRFQDVVACVRRT